MNQNLSVMAKTFVNLIYPLHCMACGKSLEASKESPLCDFCQGQIKFNPKPQCKLCGRSMETANALCAECKKRKFHFDRAYSACLYEGVLKDLIHLFKYRGKIALGKILSGLMIDFAAKNDEVIDGIDMITFVPLEFKLLPKREFNQSKVLALSISRRFDIPLSDTLRKVRPTKRQNELSRSERLANLKDAFKTKARADLENLKLLLIDDVMTTGATLSECSKALARSGAAEVRCFTLARGALELL